MSAVDPGGPEPHVVPRLRRSIAIGHRAEALRRFGHSAHDAELLTFAALLGGCFERRHCRAGGGRRPGSAEMRMIRRGLENRHLVSFADNRLWHIRGRALHAAVGSDAAAGRLTRARRGVQQRLFMVDHLLATPDGPCWLLTADAKRRHCQSLGVPAACLPAGPRTRRAEAGVGQHQRRSDRTCVQLASLMEPEGLERRHQEWLDADAPAPSPVRTLRLRVAAGKCSSTRTAPRPTGRPASRAAIPKRARREPAPVAKGQGNGFARTTAVGLRLRRDARSGPGHLPPSASPAWGSPLGSRTGRSSPGRQGPGGSRNAGRRRGAARIAGRCTLHSCPASWRMERPHPSRPSRPCSRATPWGAMLGPLPNQTPPH